MPARESSSSSVHLQPRIPQNPLVEGRTGRGTTFVRGPCRLSTGGRLVLRDNGRTRPARVRPSPSRAAAGSQPMARLSAAAGGGLLLTVVAVARVYHSRSRRSAAAVEGDAQAALGARFDGRGVALERGDRPGDVELGAWIARNTNSPVGPRLRLTPSMPSTEASDCRNPVIAPKLPRPFTITSVAVVPCDAASAAGAALAAASRAAAATAAVSASTAGSACCAGAAGSAGSAGADASAA